MNFYPEHRRARLHPRHWLGPRLNSFFCHTSKISPVTPLFATHPKTPSGKSFACHTYDTPQGSPTALLACLFLAHPPSVLRAQSTNASLTGRTPVLNERMGRRSAVPAALSKGQIDGQRIMVGSQNGPMDFGVTGTNGVAPCESGRTPHPRHHRHIGRAQRVKQCRAAQAGDRGPEPQGR